MLPLIIDITISAVSFGLSFFFLYTRKWKKSSIGFNISTSIILFIFGFILNGKHACPSPSLYLLLCCPLISLAIIKLTDLLSWKILERNYLLTLRGSSEKLARGQSKSITDDIFSAITLALITLTHLLSFTAFQNFC